MRKRTKGNKARVSVGIVGCASILLAACGSTASTSAKTVSTKTANAKANLGDVTTQQARKIVAQYNVENNASNKTVSTTVQAQDETGFALQSDNSWFRYKLQNGHGPAWQKTHYVPFYSHVLSVQALRGSGWPKRFATITAQTASPTSSKLVKGGCDELLVFVQNHSNGKWRVQTEPSIATSEVSKVQLASVGSPLSVNDHSLAMAPDFLAEQITGQLAVWGNGGVSPSLLPASIESNGCVGLSWLKTAKKNFGLTGGGNWTFTVTAVPASGSQAIQSYAVRGGGAIVSVVADINITDSEPPYSSAYITNSSTTGNIIKGVHYSSNTYPFLSDVAVYDPPRGQGQPEIIGSYTRELWPATGVVATGSAS
jgi:hypothetical protein